MLSKSNHSNASITLSPPKSPLSDSESLNELKPAEDDVRYNERTGRPIRANRSKRVRSDLVSVDSIDFEEYLFDTDEVDAEDFEGGTSATDSDADNRERDLVTSKKLKKGKERARDLSPSLPPPSPGSSPTPQRSITPASDTLQHSLSHALGPTDPSGAPPAPIQLVFNVPAGFQGPFVVQLDMDSLMARSKCTTSQDNKPIISRQNAGPGFSARDEVRVSSTHPFPVPRSFRHTTGLGFGSLPPELRNKVYRLLFVGDTVALHDKRDLSRSSSFLRTCRQIYAEGRTVLYGENVFKLDRCTQMRGHYYDKTWSEIGYKDFERFLKVIGPKNISYMQEMRMQLTDGAPSAFPNTSYETRRFINDVHLRECLKMLAKYSRLQKLTLGFWGRRQVALWDLDFLTVIRTIKVRKLELERRYHGDSRTVMDVRESLMAAMVRVESEDSKSSAKQ